MAEAWKPRVYISDHQSSAGKKDVPRVMLFRPRASSRVFLPDGQEVSWREGKVSVKQTSTATIHTAEAAYDQWMEHVLKDLPLGAFARVDDKSGAVYMDAYPIPDGPAGEGTRGYFLVDIAGDGPVEISANASARYGAPPEPDKKSSFTLSLSRKVKPGKLPVGFDEKLNGYRVLPKTLNTYFQTRTKDVILPTVLSLKQGRYLISLDSKSGKSLTQLKIKSPMNRGP